MPQMGPMLWMIFPMLMLFLLLLSMNTLESEVNVNVTKNEKNEGFKKKMMW